MFSKRITNIIVFIIITLLLLCLSITVVKAIEPVYDDFPFVEDFEDTAYPAKYGNKTPPHKGTEFGYVTIPSIKLKQTVYDGDANTQRYNLSNWHWVTSRSGYKIGETQICIYFHNYDTYTTSANGVKNLNIGEYFTFTTNENVYLYRIYDKLSEWREAVLDEPDTIYLVTCGRGEFRYKDLVVVGKMEAVYTLEEWETEKYKITYNEQAAVEEEPKETEETLLNTSLSVEYSDEYYIISVKDNMGNIVPGFKLGLFDKEGIVAIDNEKRMVYFQEDEPWKFKTDLKGAYAVGAIETPDGYQTPEERELNIISKNKVIEKEIGLESTIEVKENNFVDMMIVISVITSVVVVLGTIVIIIKRNKKY